MLQQRGHECCGLYKPRGQSIAEKMLFMVATMAAEMERDLIRERTPGGLAAAGAQGRRPPSAGHDILAIAIARPARGEPVAAIAGHLRAGRSALYQALVPYQEQAPLPG